MAKRFDAEPGRSQQEPREQVSGAAPGEPHPPPGPTTMPARGHDPASGALAPYPSWVDAWPGGPVPARGDAPTVPMNPPRQPQPSARSAQGISRRVALVGAGAGAVGLGAAGIGLGAFLLNRSSSGHETAQGPSLPSLLASDAAKIQHLLRRAGFGATPGEIDEYLALGVPGAIDRLLGFAAIPDDLASRLSAIHFDFTTAADLVRWWLLRMIYSRHPLEEKMTLFWHGVLTSSVAKLGGRERFPYLIAQNQVLRAKGLGRFDDLLHDISIDAAMLYWLDGRTSTGKSPNENYAREAMELFSLGISDVHGKPNYTQSDVHQGALALAGWTDVDGTGMFVPRRAYQGQVTYLGKTGTLHLDDVVKLLCAHPATGRFLAWRMWRFFAYNTTLDDPVLQPLADAYYTSGHTIAAMVRAMLNSPEFFGAKAYRGRIKSPVEFLVGAIRALGIAVGYDDLKGAPALLQQMGQLPFAPPNVSGWDGDKDSTNWLGTGTWMARVNFINTLAAAATTSAAGTRQQLVGAVAPMQQLLSAYHLASAEDVAAYLLAALVDNAVTDDRHALLKTTLTPGGAGGPSLNLAGGGTIAAAGVRQALYLVMSMPEFQLN